MVTLWRWSVREVPLYIHNYFAAYARIYMCIHICICKCIYICNIYACYICCKRIWKSLICIWYTLVGWKLPSCDGSQPHAHIKGTHKAHVQQLMLDMPPSTTWPTSHRRTVRGCERVRGQTNVWVLCSSLCEYTQNRFVLLSQKVWIGAARTAWNAPKSALTVVHWPVCQVYSWWQGCQASWS